MKLSEVVACVRGDVFATKLVTAARSDTIASVARHMREHRVGAVVVVEGRKPVGIVTDRDLALVLGADGVGAQAAVESVMKQPVETIPEGAGIFAATQCMRDAGVRRLPVVDNDGNLAGVVSIDDLIRLLGREMFNLSEGVRQEIEGK